MNPPRFHHIRHWFYRNQVPLIAVVFVGLVIWLAFFDTRGGW